MNERSASLSSEEHAMMRRVMLLAANSELFPDWEFQTIFGVERHEVRQVATSWPEVGDMNTEIVEGAALNSLNNLSGYPHGRTDWVECELGVKLNELDTLRGRAAAFLKARQGGSYVSRLR